MDNNYPRPQQSRGTKSYDILNGLWDFCFDDKNIGEKEQWFNLFPESKKITVPFSYETKSSGIDVQDIHQNIWYNKKISFIDENNDKTIIHFEGSDYLTKVWVNGTFIGQNIGGYHRFSFDITDYLIKGENSITVKVEDDLSEYNVRGKQRWKSENYGCWYIQTTGLWKTVWLEYLPKEYITDIKITPLYYENSIEIVVDTNIKDVGKLEVEVLFNGNRTKKIEYFINTPTLKEKINIYNKQVSEWGIAPWSPENPNLYDLKITLTTNICTDIIYSYFGMREISIEYGNILLNGKPLYQKLILDQGYWKDSHLTVPNDHVMLENLTMIKQLGFNGLRIHQKTEDPRFLYWCDKLGLLVWCEMPSAYAYCDSMVQMFIEQWVKVVRQNYNHPSIITWVPINESWGVPSVKLNTTQQRFTQAIYYITKSLDSKRPVIVNDGWEHTVSDIITLHDYEADGETLYQRYFNNIDDILQNRIFHCRERSAFSNGFKYNGQPIIISEFGGIAFNNNDEGWGYGDKVNSEEDFIRRFEKIVNAIKSLPFCVGFCYTQITDVQQEINGLLDENRNFKVPYEKIKQIID